MIYTAMLYIIYIIYIESRTGNDDGCLAIRPNSLQHLDHSCRLCITVHVGPHITDMRLIVELVKHQRVVAELTQHPPTM